MEHSGFVLAQNLFEFSGAGTVQKSCTGPVEQPNPSYPQKWKPDLIRSLCGMNTPHRINFADKHFENRSQRRLQQHKGGDSSDGMAALT